MADSMIFFAGMGTGLLIGFALGFGAALVVERLGIRVKICW